MLLLTLLLNDGFFFQFYPEAEFTSSLYVPITLATDAEAGSPCFAQLLQYKKIC